MLNTEFHRFYRHWSEKANDYSDLNSDHGAAFDRFFALFIIYNRLYAQATFELAQQGRPGVAIKNDWFPDGKAAKEYVHEYLGRENMIDLIEADEPSREAIQSVISFLDAHPPFGPRFGIKLDMIYGLPCRGRDLELLRKLRSARRHERGAAVLDFLYSVRCNLFHGHKDFEPVQVDVMGPANTLLSRMIEILFDRLNRPSNQS